MNIVKVSGRKKVSVVKKLMKSVKNQIGVVHFRKKDGSKRRISFRLHVVKPTYAPQPKGTGHDKQKKINEEHDLITVFDTNMIRYSKNGKKMIGRGGYKSIKLSSVTRLSLNGEIYKIID